MAAMSGYLPPPSARSNTYITPPVGAVPERDLPRGTRGRRGMMGSCHGQILPSVRSRHLPVVFSPPSWILMRSPRGCHLAG